jgi:hypothetical protein
LSSTTPVTVGDVLLESIKPNFRQKKSQAADGRLGLKMHKPWW